MKKSNLFLYSVLAMQLMACSTTPQSNAPVERRTTASAQADGAVAPVIPQDGATYHTVKAGETLYRIALESGQSYHDLVVWNNLSNPNDIKVGQVLRVSPMTSTPAPTPGNAQLGTVTAGTSGLEIKPLSSNKALPGATNVTGPRGDKRTYSDQALAELNKPDADGNTGTPDTPASTSPAATPAPVAQPAPAPAAPAPATSGEDAAIAWLWPTQGKVTGAYDVARKGIDIAGTAGQPIVAAADGKVMYAGSGIRGYGNLVILKHNNNLLSAYAHSRTILVKEGQNVTRGQKIAEMGNSDSSNVKLHFEIRQQGKPVDPTPFLPPR